MGRVIFKDFTLKLLLKEIIVNKRKSQNFRNILEIEIFLKSLLNLNLRQFA